PSTLLTISLKDEDNFIRSFCLSNDYQTLMIESCKLLVFKVDIQLTKDSDSALIRTPQILSSLVLPIRSPSSLVSLRI
ncbi:hypothetical protein PFISCL1PPCAC_25526, partial [Pristionchus fissidentatus]